jgi:hypothetical protein
MELISNRPTQDTCLQAARLSIPNRALLHQKNPTDILQEDSYTPN